MKNKMTWYWEVMGGHTHVRVFMNHAKAGNLCFRNEEFEFLRVLLGGESSGIEFIKEVEDSAG